VNIPGTLVGISHSGAIIYTTGQHWINNGRSLAGYWLDAAAYDGVQAALIDSLNLDRARGDLVVRPDGALLLVRSLANAPPAQFETWRLSEATGRFARLGVKPLLALPPDWVAIGALVAVKIGERVELYDATNPASITDVGAGALPHCLSADLDRSDGTIARGVWLPLGEYGVGVVKPGAGP
jgi:hypothetical protein